MPQVKEVIIVDNASKNIFEIEQLVLDKRVNIVKNSSNLGIAAALNIGFNIFVKNEYDCCLTLDQDSVCPSDMIEKYLKQRKERPRSLILTARNLRQR